jgi:hypothetical protein
MLAENAAVLYRPLLSCATHIPIARVFSISIPCVSQQFFARQALLIKVSVSGRQHHFKLEETFRNTVEVYSSIHHITNGERSLLGRGEERRGEESIRFPWRHFSSKRAHISFVL